MPLAAILPIDISELLGTWNFNTTGGKDGSVIYVFKSGMVVTRANVVFEI